MTTRLDEAWKKARVLVVEDDSDTLEMMELMLVNSGVREVVMVQSVDDALQTLTSGGERFDLLVSDVGLDGRDGFELVRALRAFPDPKVAHLPAIALSGYADNASRSSAVAAGFNAYLIKPLSVDALVAAAQRLLVTATPVASIESEA